MKHTKTSVCFLAVLIANSAMATIHYVPDEYATIQAAIDACNDFDTVVIAPGRYSGTGNRNIKLNGKPITVRSIDPSDPQSVNTTVIDCEGEGRGFTLYRGENADSTIAGLTITNGYALLGGAIYCYNNSSPSITNCVIITNSAVLGGAIASTNSEGHPNITNCTITANSALAGGGAIYCNGGSPKIKNCIISGNLAYNGGAIYSHNIGNPLIVNCTIAANTASGSAAGIYCYESSNLTINNSILWGNTATNASEVLVSSLGAPTSIRISYCDIQDPDENVIRDSDCTIEWGLGNIDSDPCFVEMGYIDSNQIYVAGDHHLLECSACIDAGDPDYIAAFGETDLDGHRRILGGVIDIGADEFVPLIPADIKIMPQCLNLTSKGNWLLCTIQLPEDHNVADIDTATIVLNGIIQPQWSKIFKNEPKLLAKFRRPWRSNICKDEPKLLVKFSRAEVGDMLKDVCGDASLEVWGMLNDGTVFKGTDTIKVISSNCKKKYFKPCCNKHLFYKNLRLYRSRIKCKYVLPRRVFLHRRNFKPRCLNLAASHK